MYYTLTCKGTFKTGKKCWYKARMPNGFCKTHYKAEEDTTIVKIDFNDNGLDNLTIIDIVGDDVFEIIKDYVKQLEQYDMIGNICRGLLKSGKVCRYKRYEMSLYCGHHWSQDPDLINRLDNSKEEIREGERRRKYLENQAEISRRKVVVYRQIRI